VATIHAGITDVVIEGETGLLVPERDVKAMANRIIILASEQGLARKMGQQPWKHIADYFSMEKYLAAFNGIFCAAASESIESVCYEGFFFQIACVSARKNTVQKPNLGIFWNE